MADNFRSLEIGEDAAHDSDQRKRHTMWPRAREVVGDERGLLVLRELRFCPGHTLLRLLHVRFLFTILLVRLLVDLLRLGHLLVELIGRPGRPALQGSAAASFAFSSSAS